MEYKRLPFEQYYINTSQDWRKTGKATYNVEYNHVVYTQKLLGFIPLKVSAEWECHYEENRNVIQVNFEATRDGPDWVVDVLFAAKPYDNFMFEEREIQLKCCKGWMKMYSMLKHQVREAVKKLFEQHKDAEVEVVGWSLGSGLAQYCAQDLFFNLGIQSYLYTDGSVKPWKGFISKKKTADLKWYLGKCTKAVYNFMHRSDVVTYMPPFSGYFAMNPVKVGKFKFFGLFNPNKWHTEYGESYLYENMQ